MVELTTSSKIATNRFLGIHEEDGTPANGMYKVHSLKELEVLFRKENPQCHV